MVLGAAGDNLVLELELDDGDGLVHLPHQHEALVVVLLIRIAELGLEGLTGITAVDLHRQTRQGQHIDPIAALEGGRIGIAQGDTYRIGHAGGIADRSPHPEHIVIAPLEVEVVVGQEALHDDISPWAAVEDVAHDMQPVDRQALDGLAQGRDEVIGLPRLDDGVEDGADVGRLLGVHTVLVRQLLCDVAVLRGQRLAHLTAGVLLADALQHLDELIERDLVPVIGDLARLR